MDYISYSKDAFPAVGAPAATRRRDSFTTAAFITVFIGIVIIGTVSIFALVNAFPTRMKALLITVDQFGLTSAGANEQLRRRAINQLAITHEEKTVLVNRTVFFGATRDMVKLALGDPACFSDIPATKEYAASEQWVYFVENDPKPTLLLFQKNELVNAGKVSALDICK